MNIVAKAHPNDVVDAASPLNCATLANRRGLAVEWRISPGVTPYAEASAAMENQVEAMRAHRANEHIWLLEHPPLYTAGTSARPEHLLKPQRFPVHKAGRGGQYTYHGPGQRIAYVMLDLAQRGRDVRCFVSHLESWIIETLAAFGVKGERRDGRIGIWIAGRTDRPEAKIASVGIRIRHWITFHGIAINRAPDLSHFAGIVPCGAAGYGVTSLADLGINASVDDLDEALRTSFMRVFGDEVSPAVP